MLACSSISSSSVATVSVVVMWPALMVTVEGGVPLRVLAVSVTFTFTVSAVSDGGYAVIVNVAGVPSVMLVGLALIVTCGSPAGARVTVMV